MSDKTELKAHVLRNELAIIIGCQDGRSAEEKAEAVIAWMDSNDRRATIQPTAVKRDGCKFCFGAKGGVPGNENVIGGAVICDYCTALLMHIKEKEQADPTGSLFKSGTPVAPADAVRDAERDDTARLNYLLDKAALVTYSKGQNFYTITETLDAAGEFDFGDVRSEGRAQIDAALKSTPKEPAK